jgi:putative sterol carrier protein
MAKYLTQEWLDEYKRVANATQPERPGVSARMEYKIAGGPMGEVDTNAAFMQGRMKVAGNMAKLLSLLPLANSPEFKKLEEEMPATNTYD